MQRRHLVGAGFDDVLLAVHQVQVSIAVNPSEVAHPHPAGSKGGAAGLVVAEVLARVRAAQPHLTDLTRRQRSACRVPDLHTAVDGPADRARPLRIEDHAELGGRCLGRGVVVDDRRVREVPREFCGHGGGQCRGCGAAENHVGQALAVQHAGADQLDSHGRYDEDRAGLVLPGHPHEPFGSEPGQDECGRPGVECVEQHGTFCPISNRRSSTLNASMSLRRSACTEVTGWEGNVGSP